MGGGAATIAPPHSSGNEDVEPHRLGAPSDSIDTNIGLGNGNVGRHLLRSPCPRARDAWTFGGSATIKGNNVDVPIAELPGANCHYSSSPLGTHLNATKMPAPGGCGDEGWVEMPITDIIRNGNNLATPLEHKWEAELTAHCGTNGAIVMAGTVLLTEEIHGDAFGVPYGFKAQSLRRHVSPPVKAPRCGASIAAVLGGANTNRTGGAISIFTGQRINFVLAPTKDCLAKQQLDFRIVHFAVVDSLSSGANIEVLFNNDTAMGPLVTQWGVDVHGNAGSFYAMNPPSFAAGATQHIFVVYDKYRGGRRLRGGRGKFLKAIETDSVTSLDTFVVVDDFGKKKVVSPTTTTTTTAALVVPSNTTAITTTVVPVTGVTRPPGSTLDVNLVFVVCISLVAIVALIVVFKCCKRPTKRYCESSATRMSLDEANDGESKNGAGGRSPGTAAGGAQVTDETKVRNFLASSVLPPLYYSISDPPPAPPPLPPFLPAPYPSSKISSCRSKWTILFTTSEATNPHWT